MTTPTKSKKIKVKALDFTDMNNWEIHLFEEAIGCGMDSLRELRDSNRPKHMFYIAMMWIVLRRTMGDELTLKQVGEGPYELDMPEQSFNDLAEAATDPKDEPAENESEKTTNEPGD